ncbi:hypothetical protein FN846DRAFT_909715 [Sphaerosporella brunnea]|uniref:Uncharacterized protein n=1 Tax=Sphaerosporella brunnea TaxID=1250544 RepID=A0A5J5EQ13_9PEZI|nr:hypothetical protein FN846DRAFT_909715 [Sphaerosporella brunnea]
MPGIHHSPPLPPRCRPDVPRRTPRATSSYPDPPRRAPVRPVLPRPTSSRPARPRPDPSPGAQLYPYNELFKALGINAAEVPKLLRALDEYFRHEEEWLSNRPTQWFNKVIQLGEKLGVETAEIGLPALHSLHLLLKRVDEKVGARPKRSNAAAKKLAADEKIAVPEMRTEVKASAAHTRLDTTDQKKMIVELRTKGALLEEEAGRRRRETAKQEQEVIALKKEQAKQVVARRIEAAMLEKESAELKLETSKKLIALEKKNMTKVYKVHLVLYMTSDKTRLYRFVDGLLRFATQNPDAAWYRALPPASPTHTHLNVNVRWILPHGVPGAAVAGSQARNSTPLANSDAAAADKMTAAADKMTAAADYATAATDRMNRMEVTMNVLAATLANVQQAVTPDVLGEIVKENSNPTGTVITMWCLKRTFDSIDGALNALESRMGNVEESVKPEVLADIVKKNPNTADSVVAMAWPRHKIESIEVA